MSYKKFNATLEKIDLFLEKGIRQFIEGSTIIQKIKSFYLGKALGNELVYTNSNNGKLALLHTKFLLLENDLYIIQCSMDFEGACEADKTKFMNSVSFE